MLDRSSPPRPVPARPRAKPRNLRRPLAWLLGAWASAALLGCVPLRTEYEDLVVESAVVESQKRFRKEYLLAPGDTIEVVVLNNHDVSRTVTLRPDGYISLPILDDVSAAGMSVSELDERLTALFTPRLREPEVTVIATSVRPAMVYVYGEVARTSPVELRLAATAAQAIAQAGGFTRQAGTKHVTIIRLTEDGRLVAMTPTAGMKGQPDPYMLLQTVALQPDDMIFVPESNIAQFDRWLQSYVNAPLSGVNSILQTYLNFRLIEFYDEAIQG